LLLNDADSASFLDAGMRAPVLNQFDRSQVPLAGSDGPFNIPVSAHFRRVFFVCAGSARGAYAAFPSSPFTLPLIESPLAASDRRQQSAD
jgi:hypothetical protein